MAVFLGLGELLHSPGLCRGRLTRGEKEGGQNKKKQPKKKKGGGQGGEKYSNHEGRNVETGHDALLLSPRTGQFSLRQ